MNIIVKTIPHDKQAYPTVGDWRFTPEGDLSIFISDMNNWKYELLVAVHEIIEVALCKDRGITTEVVDSFDIEFEKSRQNGNTDEPGDDPDAPYRKEHFFATSIERLVAGELNVDWDIYDKVVSGL